MKEEDDELIGLWKSSDKNEEKMRGAISLLGENYFQQRSHDIFNRIKRNMTVELWASAVAVVAFPFLFMGEPVFWWLTGLMLLAVVVTIKIYGSYLRNVSRIHEGSISDSLRKKKDLLGKYLRRMHLTNYILVPVSVLVGYFRGAPNAELSTEEIGVVLAICAVVSGVLILAIRAYIQSLYGKYYDQVKELLLQLEG